MVSSDVFNEHEQYFKSHGYAKHSTFDSAHLLEMKTGSIDIVPEVEGYQRKGGVHIIDRFSGLSDFERAEFHNLRPKCKYVNGDGTINYEGVETGISITDPSLADHILSAAFLSRLRIGASKHDIYSTYEDQIYSYKGEKLHFAEAEKYVLPIGEEQN